MSEHASTAPRLGIGVIGAGRVGAVLGAAWRAEGHAVTGAYAVSETSRARAADLLPGVPLLGVAEIVERSEVVLLAVPDDQLAGLAAGIAATGLVPGGQVFVHVSGAHGTAVLEPLAACGSAVIALHPAMTFTGTAADLPRLIGCPVAVTARGAAEAIAHALVVETGGEPVPVAEADRAQYHAALSHGANHLTVLVSQARDLLADIGIEDPGAYLRPLLGAALEESLRRGAAALTGPVMRGDAGTVAAHLAAIAEAESAATWTAPRDTETTYRALALAALARAGLGPHETAAIRDILSAPDPRTQEDDA
ncbi:DUF2520 domain-containing protein [Brachybacterium huguangmaarense]|uniref:DUF2520 domain-containing protein n=1 Tax=Brachybacterium huguangmaarense TaxID=1652028 RepID=A0ABY6G0K1_9MICO|nr:DUF2520 domain-containing protein [Brachybacterium huguangmaarense]UYG16662.1 DUF2520 domain-containing protein [Brachybacterium huguangmaarense]